jgi:hypothetical protein
VGCCRISREFLNAGKSGRNSRDEIRGCIQILTAAKKFVVVGESVKRRLDPFCFTEFNILSPELASAGHAVVVSAGGKVETPDGEVLCYNKANLLNPYFIVSV